MKASYFTPEHLINVEIHNSLINTCATEEERQKENLSEEQIKKVLEHRTCIYSDYISNDLHFAGTHILVNDKDVTTDVLKDKLKSLVCIDGQRISNGGYEDHQKTVVVDLPLAQAIKHLNFVGVKTTACCSGHILEPSGESYIDELHNAYSVYIPSTKDKAEGYIMFPSSMNRAVMDTLKEFVDTYPYDKNKVRFEVVCNNLGNGKIIKQIRWKTAVNRDDIEYACYVLTRFLLDNF